MYLNIKYLSYHSHIIYCNLDTKLDIYFVDRSFWPFAKMTKYFQIEFPLLQLTKRKRLTNEISKMIKIFEYVNDVLNDNVRIIENIDKWVNANVENSIGSQNFKYIETIYSP
jgi:hypothetical protein